MHGKEGDRNGKAPTLYTVKMNFKKRNLVRLNMINFEQIRDKQRIYSYYNTMEADM